jgi:hypothetical protein
LWDGATSIVCTLCCTHRQPDVHIGYATHNNSYAESCPATPHRSILRPCDALVPQSCNAILPDTSSTPPSILQTSQDSVHGHKTAARPFKRSPVLHLHDVWCPVAPGPGCSLPETQPRMDQRRCPLIMSTEVPPQRQQLLSMTQRPHSGARSLNTTRSHQLAVTPSRSSVQVSLHEDATSFVALFLQTALTSCNERFVIMLHACRSSQAD